MPRVVEFGGEAVGSHTEGENVETKIGLTLIECSAAKCVNFFDRWICHGETACGGLFAMDHDQGAGAVVSKVVFVWVANVEGKMIVTIGPHL